MSTRSDLSSSSPHTQRRGMLALLDRVERLERQANASGREGVLIGRTEHGDNVYGVATASSEVEPTGNGVIAAIKARLGG